MVSVLVPFILVDVPAITHGKSSSRHTQKIFLFGALSKQNKKRREQVRHSKLKEICYIFLNYSIIRLRRSMQIRHGPPEICKLSALHHDADIPNEN